MHHCAPIIISPLYSLNIPEIHYLYPNAIHYLPLRPQSRDTMNNRHAFRAKWHDYNQGIFFVTICAHEKAHIFGRITSSEMTLSTLGKIVNACIADIPNHHNAEIIASVVMPNHIHMIIALGTQILPPIMQAQFIAPLPPLPSADIVRAQYIAPTSTRATTSSNHGCLKPPKHAEPVTDNHYNSQLAVVIRTFKAAVTRMARAQNIAPIPGVWQRSFHEHIIRNQQAFDNIMNYIGSNIANWTDDCFHPTNSL